MCGPNYVSFPSNGVICGLTICPDESIFHYYYCCYGLLGACCFYLRTWVIFIDDTNEADDKNIVNSDIVREYDTSDKLTVTKIILLVFFILALVLCGIAAAVAAFTRTYQQRLQPSNATLPERDVHYYPPREHTVYFTDHTRDRSL
ncbi:unnamed protein product [Thelazia callipaeda]|uniref:EGF-like domain-containing protein n=1 Tax=Thelazia callipaeda TaxID=103827 RepID=A0A0N5D9S3_THECL|nr:unnamed protein product [Thelazia callipaeda]